MPTLTAIAPQFIVEDVRVAAEYYRDVLGFRILGYFLDPPVFAMVARDRAEIHFGKADAGAAISPNIERRKISSDAYIWTTDLDALHEELVEKGALIVEPPSMRVYRCYEMKVQDPFGFQLVFSMDFEHGTG